MGDFLGKINTLKSGTIRPATPVGTDAQQTGRPDQTGRTDGRQIIVTPDTPCLQGVFFHAPTRLCRYA